MGAVGQTITNVVRTVTQPVRKLFTAPGKLNAGDIAVLGTAGLAAPTVDAIRHPGDTPFILGAATLGGAAINAATSVPAAVAASSTPAATAAGSAGAYSAAFNSAGANLAGVSNPLDLNLLAAPATAAPTGAIEAGSSTGGIWGFLGRATDSVKSLFAPLLGLQAVKALAGGLGSNGSRDSGFGNNTGGFLSSLFPGGGSAGTGAPVVISNAPGAPPAPGSGGDNATAAAATDYTPFLWIGAIVLLIVFFAPGFFKKVARA